MLNFLLDIYNSGVVDNITSNNNAGEYNPPQPDNHVTTNSGFWNYVPLIAVILLVIVWIIVVKAIKKKHTKKDDEESK